MRGDAVLRVALPRVAETFRRAMRRPHTGHSTSAPSGGAIQGDGHWREHAAGE